jgi:hypothetical protein
LRVYHPRTCIYAYISDIRRLLTTTTASASDSAILYGYTYGIQCAAESKEEIKPDRGSSSNAMEIDVVDSGVGDSSNNDNLKSIQNAHTQQLSETDLRDLMRNWIKNSDEIAQKIQVYIFSLIITIVLCSILL